LNNTSVTSFTPKVSTIVALTFAIVCGPCANWAKSSEPAPHPQSPIFDAGVTAEYSEAKDLMRQKKWVEAVVILRAVQKRIPSDKALPLDLARALAYSGRREEALNVLVQLVNQEKGARQKALIRKIKVFSRFFLTNSTFQIYQDGVNLMLADKYRPALDRFEKALEQDPANAEILTRLGQSLVLEGDFDSADERLRLARRLDPYEPEIQLWLGRALQQRGEVDEALTELRAAYPQIPSSETAVVWYATALFSNGQKAQAMQLLENDLDRQPRHLRALVELSRLRLSSAGEKDTSAAWQARKDLQVALSRLGDYFTSAPTAPIVVVTDTSGETDTTESLGGATVTADDLTINPKVSEADLKKEINDLLTEADGRINESSVAN
jgi:tetratricopeptide (TPR) repeat protein